jgi:hypothetical protein
MLRLFFVGREVRVSPGGGLNSVEWVMGVCLQFIRSVRQRPRRLCESIERDRPLQNHLRIITLPTAGVSAS